MNFWQTCVGKKKKKEEEEDGDDGGEGLCVVAARMRLFAV